MIPYKWLEQADSQIALPIQRTPLIYDAARNLYIIWGLRRVTGLFLKCGAYKSLFGNFGARTFSPLKLDRLKSVFRLSDMFKVLIAGENWDE
jgi:hypothetical protein